jgi:hypothetical protein
MGEPFLARNGQSGFARALPQRPDNARALFADSLYQEVTGLPAGNRGQKLADPPRVCRPKLALDRRAELAIRRNSRVPRELAGRECQVVDVAVDDGQQAGLAGLSPLEELADRAQLRQHLQRDGLEVMQ